MRKKQAYRQEDRKNIQERRYRKGRYKTKNETRGGRASPGGGRGAIMWIDLEGATGKSIQPMSTRYKHDRKAVML